MVRSACPKSVELLRHSTLGSVDVRKMRSKWGKGSGSFGGKKGPFPWSSFPLSAPNGAYCVKWGKARNYLILFLIFSGGCRKKNLIASVPQSPSHGTMLGKPGVCCPSKAPVVGMPGTDDACGTVLIRDLDIAVR
jgi:hypothetical protein